MDAADVSYSMANINCFDYILCIIAPLCRYNQGRLQTNPGRRDVVSLVRDVAQEVTYTSEEKVSDEIEEWELEELLVWTTMLNFEE